MAQKSEIRSPIIASWILLLTTCLIAIIPVLGFLSWIIGSATILIAMILGIVVITKGGTWNGILILMTSIFVVPLFIFVAPLVTTALTSSAVDSQSIQSTDSEATEATPSAVPTIAPGEDQLPELPPVNGLD